MKQITIAGTVGRDAETRQAGQSTVTSWSVAVDDGWGDKKTTMWFDCSMWGQRGEKLAAHITKGGKMSVTGDLSTREHNGKTYLQVRVDNLTLQGGKREGSNQQSGGYGGGPMGGIEDEIPFGPEVRA